MRTLIAAVVAATLALSTLPALAHDYTVGTIAIAHPWTRATPPNANVAGGYFVLRNNGAEPDRILGGSTAAASSVEIHEMAMTGDVMRMRPMPAGVAIEPGTEVSFAPGSYHLMLIGLDAPLVEGTRVPLTLRFEKAGTVEVELAVDAMGSGSAVDGHAGH